MAFVDQNVYVSKAGNDSTGTGAITAPYLTITGALNAIKTANDASTSKRYQVIVAAGLYAENVALQAWVWVCGMSPAMISTKISGTVSADPTNWNGAQSGQGGLANVEISGAITVTPPNAHDVILSLANVYCTGNVTVRCPSLGSGVSWTGGVCFGNVTITNGGATGLNNVQFLGSVALVEDGTENLGSGLAAINASIAYCDVGGSLTLTHPTTVPNSGQSQLLLIATNAGSVPTATGLGILTANPVYGQFAGSLINNRNCGLFPGGSN